MPAQQSKRLEILKPQPPVYLVNLLLSMSVSFESD